MHVQKRKQMSTSTLMTDLAYGEASTSAFTTSTNHSYTSARAIDDPSGGRGLGVEENTADAMVRKMAVES